MSKQTFNENGFTYEVYDNGTVTASGTIAENPASRKGMNNIMPSGYNSKTDDKGHLIAARHGGAAKEYNVSSQNRHINRGEYKRIENAESRLAARGNTVRTSKTAYVSQPGTKPDAYMINDTVITPDGKNRHIYKSIQNEDIAVQNEWNDESAAVFSQISSGYDNPGARPAGMTESEYAQLMEETESGLLSVKDDYNTDSVAETSSDTSPGQTEKTADDAAETISADSGVDDGCGM